MARNSKKTGRQGIPINLEALQGALDEKGWSQKTLAEESGLSSRTIERLVADGKTSIKTLLLISRILGVQATSLHPPETTPFVHPLELPADLNDFVGRDGEMQRIQASMGRGSGKTLGTAVFGMGGLGKTTLVARIGHTIRGRYPDGVVYFDLHGVSAEPLTEATVMGRIVRNFRPDVLQIPVDTDELLALYRTTLHNRRVLVVLDNASGELQIRNLIAGNRSAFLITSRKKLALDGIPSIPLEDFTPTQSMVLLRGIVGTIGTDSQLATLAEICAYLPLALRVAGDFLRIHTNWTVESYLEALAMERLRMLRVGDDKHKDVEYVLKLSAVQLVREIPELARRWNYLAEWAVDFDEDAAAAVWGPPYARSVVLDGLTQLVARSMLLYDNKSRRYRLHDLMQPIALGLFS